MEALKKKIQTVDCSEKKTNLELVSESQKQKAEIENIKKVITEKIKDPALAKKAAMIISEMMSK